MIETSNQAVILILTFEALILLVMLNNSVRIFLNYRRRKKKPILFLTQALSFLTFGILITMIGFFMDTYFPRSDQTNYYSILSFSLLFVTIAISNIFIYAFTETIYLDENRNRMFIIALLEGIAIGLIVTRSTLLPNVNKLNPPIMIYHVSLAFMIYILLGILSFKERKNTMIQKARWGLLLIGLFAIFNAMAFSVLFFGMLSYYLTRTIGYVFVLLFALIELFAAEFGYLGYIMPKWFQSLVRLNMEE